MNEIKPQPLPTPSGLKNAQTSKDSEMQSTIGKAIELLSQGTRLPRYMIEELHEQGIDVVSFHQYHLKK